MASVWVVECKLVIEEEWEPQGSCDPNHTVMELLAMALAGENPGAEYRVREYVPKIEEVE